ncbi:MAG TPA: sugar transferase [Pyrinomonadaceae bacterium]|nr:sugar transferase [Pyrinomonadaceae bacterium]
MFKKYPLYKFILAFADLILLLISFALAVRLRFYEIPLSELLDKPFLFTQTVFVLGYSLIWIVIFQHFHLYKINIFLSVSDQILAIIKSLAYGLVGLIVVSFFIKGLDWTDSRAVIFYFICLSFISITLFRTVIFKKLFTIAAQKKIFQRKVLIIGTDKTAKMVAVQLEMDDSHGFKVVGFIDDKLEKDTRIFEELTVVGKTNRLKNLVKRHEVEEIIIAQSEITHQKLLDIIDKAKDTSATVRLASELYNIIPEKVLVEKYLGVPVVLMPQNYDNVLFSVYKRVFDVVVASLALIFFAIPFMIIALLIKLSSKGAVFHSDTRIGKDGNPFKFYKFRTMKVNNDDSIHREFVRDLIKQSGESGGEIKKIINDPRITKIGKFLRKTSLDELPQLFNVIRGEMSLVGPRPCLPYEWEEYDEWHRRRFSVIPGCTGLWQVSGRSAVDFNDMVILDLFYIDNMSPLFDLKIMLKTIPVMLLGKGGY